MLSTSVNNSVYRVDEIEDGKKPDFLSHLIVRTILGFNTLNISKSGA